MAKPSYHSDEQTLLGFKAAISLDPFNTFLDWSPNHAFCNWTAITCSSRRQRVVSLNLTGKGLVGPISPLLGNLSFLKAVDLSNNSFEGPIPYQLGRLFRLRRLRLSRNKLAGPIPSSLGDCRSLQSLILAYNNLSGSIPSEFSLLSNLETLALADNKLTGIIPPFLGNLSLLITIDLPENRLQGGIPAELGMLSHLNWLDLCANRLIGSIPVALSNCTRLQMLELCDNFLKGPIQREFGRLSELQVVRLWKNQLTGEIPRSVGNWTQLQELYLDKNQLSGTVPLEFGKLQQLRRFLLWQNHFVSGSSGLSILIALTNCSSLTIIDLGFNHLTGVLPTSIGRLSNSLSFLSLQSNDIEGNIPNEIGNQTNLATITLEGNNFNGTVPSTLGGLSNLEILALGTNNLHGSIPENFGQSKRLGFLDLHGNMLSGRIPDSLGELPQLRRLVLHHNQLSGRIPASLGRCKTLEMVDLAHNKLTGSIPLEVAGLQNLQFYFNVSGNLLQGSISEMSKMVMVLAIDVSQNNFSGGIPNALASCKGLEYLNLSSNAFEGSIPASLADLQNLQYMDLSCNNLSGTIPMAFKKMKMLRHLNLSSNRLTGEVPKGGAFATLDASEVMGNLGLCGGWINLPPCSQSKQKQPSISKKVIIPVVVGIVILIMSLLLIAFSFRCKHSSTPTLKVWPPNISYKELVDATGGFNDDNLLGIGSFGSVYKGVLNNGTNIAVKVLKVQDERAHKSFGRECKALKRVRHRNIIKIISSCSNFDFKALILPLMTNGSLERWLYPHEGGRCRLNLSDRIRIAMEIAEGMAYLHHYCFVQLIHCDLKPSNVLLGDDMTSYIADFGISNLIHANSMDSSTSADALRGSIGYIAPEYGIGCQLTSKGDVYSYGILVLELLTMKRPTDDIFNEGINLQKWIEMHFPNKISNVVDNFLLIDVNESEISTVMECLTQFLQIGLFCTRESPQERPNMMEIVDRLKGWAVAMADSVGGVLVAGGGGCPWGYRSLWVTTVAATIVAAHSSGPRAVHCGMP
ncbi:putative leucine-rich repeat receptor-like serine/threonine-protein kinase At2g24130 [Cryptomeria japonica]|uniref:putative leucine-rich repeat receptor-like serine/threonine-protein kinase At2g24130 n=1 Tax=Cryptomeria japonica TaxID=3369 RepID=UPI0027DA4808|nr:putative leucine-rich repeat receptor-like serine/threonine-protein kinase At2g24130 [Cryptomeria japonica]